MGQILELDNYSLVVYIPTYNRSALLKRAIESAVVNFPSFHHPYIVVLDSSVDELSKLVVDNCVEEFTNANIVYKRNAVNGGIDVNMLKFLELGISAKYCLMLGDDDIVTGSFKTLLDKYINEDFDLLLLNMPIVNTEKLLLNKPGDISVLFERIWDKMPYGSMVVNLPVASKVKYQVTPKYLGTSHAYSALVWEMLVSTFSTKCVMLTNGIAVLYGDEVKTWQSYNYEIFIKGIPKWFNLLPPAITSKKAVFKKYQKQYFTTDFVANLLESDRTGKETLVATLTTGITGLKASTYKYLLSYYGRNQKVPYALKLWQRTKSELKKMLGK